MYNTAVKAAIITALPIWTPGLQRRYNSSCGVDLHNSSVVCGASPSCYSSNGYSACSATTFTLPSSNRTVQILPTASTSLSTNVIPLSIFHHESTATTSTLEASSSIPRITSSAPTATISISATSSALATTSSIPTTTSIPTSTSSTPTTSSSTSVTTSSAATSTSSALTTFSSVPATTSKSTTTSPSPPASPTTSQPTETRTSQTISTDTTKSSLWSTYSSLPVHFSSTISPTASQVSYESSTVIGSSILAHHSIGLAILNPSFAATGISTTQSFITGVQSTISTITIFPSTLSTRTRVPSTQPAKTGNPTSQPTPSTHSIGPISPTPTSLIVVPSTIVVLFAIIGAVLASRREWIFSVYKHLTRPSQPHESRAGSPVISDARDDELSVRDVETPPPPYSPYEPSSADQELITGSYITGTISWTAMEVLGQAYPISDHGRHRST